MLVKEYTICQYKSTLYTSRKVHCIIVEEYSIVEENTIYQQKSTVYQQKSTVYQQKSTQYTSRREHSILVEEYTVYQQKSTQYSSRRAHSIVFIPNPPSLLRMGIEHGKVCEGLVCVGNCVAYIGYYSSTKSPFLLSNHTQFYLSTSRSLQQCDVV